MSNYEPNSLIITVENERAKRNCTPLEALDDYNPEMAEKIRALRARFPLLYKLKSDQFEDAVYRALIRNERERRRLKLKRAKGMI